MNDQRYIVPNGRGGEDCPHTPDGVYCYSHYLCLEEHAEFMDEVVESREGLIRRLSEALSKAYTEEYYEYSHGGAKTPETLATEDLLAEARGVLGDD